MKQIKIAVLITISCLWFSFAAQNSGGLKGQIMPAEGIAQVLLISGSDTLMVPLQDGRFALNQLKARTYQVLVKTIPPYQEFRLNEVAVIDSAITDIGQIKLQK